MAESGMSARPRRGVVVVFDQSPVTLLVYAIPRAPRPIRRLFESRLSYALYLVHGPVLWMLGGRLYAAAGWHRDSERAHLSNRQVDKVCRAAQDWVAGSRGRVSGAECCTAAPDSLGWGVGHAVDR
ncbi:hypothetical protein F4778DRAFT_763710 [Xylariomycetidae sp. FL2044]|nr:hypothetical protein F4778DRAFT_763710 [Xylariomycetidae sp. FL2044]